jgi:uncharacterized membrane protein
MSTGTTLARALGLFSLALGAYQLLAPRRFARLIGVAPDEDRVTATRLVGAREIGAAGGLLTSAKPAAWPWVRLGGDLMDAGLLARAMATRDAQRDRIALAMLAVGGITLVDLLSGMVIASETAPQGQATTTSEGTRLIRRAVTVQASRQTAYDAWRDFARLPRFMQHLEEVQVLDERRSHWRAKGPLGTTVQWDAEITEDAPGEILAWRSTGGSAIGNNGRVRFVDAPGDRGTEIHVELEYAPPLGAVGAAAARLVGEEPAVQVADDLRRFKQILETGRVPKSDATIGDRKLRQRPAQPPEQQVWEPRDTGAPAAGQATPTTPSATAA